MKLWRKAVYGYREREITITVFELFMFSYSFGCRLISPLSFQGLFVNTERPYAHMSLLDAFYYAFVTLATIGYGDVTPHSSAGRLATLYSIVAVCFWLPNKVGAVVPNEM